MTDLSKERKAYFTKVDKYGMDQGINPKFYKTILEEYVKSTGHSSWEITDDEYDAYKAWRKKDQKQGSGIPK